MKRIAIVGSTGSGKSTLAKFVADYFQLPHTELDSLYWLPNWTERDPAEFRSFVDAATANDRWVIDGGYSEVRDLVWGRADTIIWLNYGFSRTLVQLVKRTIRRNAFKEPCCNGNFESLQRSLGKNSILLWLFKTYWRNKENLSGALERYGNTREVHVFSSPRQTRLWLHHWR